MNLDNYKTISQHSNDMLQIKNQITDIYNLNDDFSNSLETCIKYSDCGKVIENIEDFENLTDVLSASIKCLEDK